MIGDNVGFVYVITNNTDGKMYIGKKQFHSKTKLPPLKGKKRKRIVIKESDWMSYYESVESQGCDAFKREILHLCTSKGEMSYLELIEQVERKVLLSDDYYNSIIQVRIHRSHVKNLK